MMAIPSGDLAGEIEVEANAARASLESVVAEALGTDPGLALETRLVEDDAGAALIDESEHADLVVVGSHGKTGLRAALLGSVSRHVVAHARCPVVVVKPKPED
jgi:nucleotide-binding universal stress UspA family protein